MSYKSGTIKYTLNGTLNGGEVFSFGFQTEVDGSPSQTQVDAGLGLITEWLGSTDSLGIRQHMSTNLKFTSCTAYGYAGGSSASVQSEGTLNIPGTHSDGPELPNQCAVVASLLTGKPGRSKRGRSYLPLLSDPQFQGQMAPSTCTQIAEAYANLMNAYLDGTASGLPQTPVVASITHGYNTPLTEVRVDTRWDVQRRRAAQEIVAGSGSADVG
uniref:Uncharacterized protein n=1 Tax=uncultured prokaryote TaxID=198431 RepID=A0A0H5Q7E8_9ZZZZ|nr:hypothetical protein [uncultured prokaryote]